MPAFLLLAAPIVAGSSTAIISGLLGCAAAIYPIHKFNQFMRKVDTSSASKETKKNHLIGRPIISKEHHLEQIEKDLKQIESY